MTPVNSNAEALTTIQCFVAVVTSSHYFTGLRITLQFHVAIVLTSFGLMLCHTLVQVQFRQELICKSVTTL